MKTKPVQAAPPAGPRALAFAGLVIVLLLLGLAGRAGRALAAIDLLYFRGQAEASRIKLEWQTASELDNAGFIILRNTSGGLDVSQYTAIPVFDSQFSTTLTFIPARGDDLTGATYVVYDENVTAGTRYFYLLQDYDTNNQYNLHGPIEIVAGQAPTAIVTPTRTGTPLTLPTITRTATPTLTRTATELPRSTVFASPTRTPAISLTPSPTGTPTLVSATQLPAVDQTLTAIAFSLTATLSGTGTATPEEGSPTASPGEALEQTAVAIAPVGSPGTETGELTGQETAGESTPGDSFAGIENAPEDNGRAPLPTGRIALLVFVFLLSGGLLTGGVIFLVRRSEEEQE